MSTAAGTRSGANASAKSVNPWAVALVVSLATFMEVLDTTIANVALRYISGGLAVSADEASWVVTTYLVSNAIVLVASGFIAKRFGRKRFYLACLLVFTIASVLCGLAWNLEVLLIFRMIQGFAGGGMVPVSQSILADAFPPAKRGQAFALFGVAVVVAPVVGPTLGGWLSDNLSWHWCFLINGPVGMVALVLVYLFVQETKPEKDGPRFDYGGFFLIALFLGTLELTLDRGQIEDWFDSSFIIVTASICAASLLLAIPWLLVKKNPILDAGLIASRQFGSCLLVMGATGAILIATTQYIPQILQENYGYTATWAGLALSPGGIVTMMMMFGVGRLGTAIQPKYLIAIGSGIIAAAMWNLTRVYADLNFGFFAWARIYIGLGLPLIFIPITSASYDGLKPSQTDQASALLNAARNIGGSIGVALASNVLAHRSQWHQSRLVENIAPSDPAYQETVNAVARTFTSQGANPAEAQSRAIGWVGEQVAMQSSFLAYIDVFWVLALVSAATVPLALILRNVDLNKGGGGGAA